MIAHIFKYTLASQFPLKSDDLNNFCAKILEYNKNIKIQNGNIRAIPCYMSTVFSEKVIGGVVSYLLFERPFGGESLPSICMPNCSKDRVCRYMIKDFAKGWLMSSLYSQHSTDLNDVNFVLAQNGFYYGRLPKVKMNATITGEIKNFLVKNAAAHEEGEKDRTRRFITLAYPKAYSPQTVLPVKPNNSTVISKSNAKDHNKEVKNKQSIVQFGKFLINMYKGLDNSTNTPPLSPDDTFNPTGVQYGNLTDVYLNLNKKKDGNYTKFEKDEYFGVKESFISALRRFLEKTLVIQKALQEMDDMLKDSFYEFVFKSVTFDPESQRQFENMEAMLKHNFIISKPAVNQVKSDTSEK